MVVRVVVRVRVEVEVGVMLAESEEVGGVVVGDVVGEVDASDWEEAVLEDVVVSLDGQAKHP